MLCSPVHCYLAPIMPHILWTLFVNDAKPMVLPQSPQSKRSSFTSTWNNSQMRVCVCVCVYFWIANCKSPPVCWYCGFESRRYDECLSVVSVVCCQVEVTASGWSLVQWVWSRSPVRGDHDLVSGRSAMVENRKRLKDRRFWTVHQYLCFSSYL